MTMTNGTGHELPCSGGCGEPIADGAEIVMVVENGQRLAFHWLCWSDWDTAAGMRANGYECTTADARAHRLKYERRR